MTQRGLSSASWYKDFIRAAKGHGDDHPPRTLRRKREPAKPLNAHQPVPSDKARMEAITNVVAMHNRGWVTPANAVKVIRDIVK